MTKRTEGHRSILKAATNATYAARRRLIAAHDAEYRDLLREERRSRGLTDAPMMTARETVEALRGRIAELEAEIAVRDGAKDEAETPPVLTVAVESGAMGASAPFFVPGGRDGH